MTNVAPVLDTTFPNCRSTLFVMPMAVMMFAVALAVADVAAKAVPVANRARAMERVVRVSFFKIDSVGCFGFLSEG
jgi:hypothetical protein